MRIALGKKTTLLDYVYVLKPRETSLLVVIGMCSAFIAAGGTVSGRGVFPLLFLALLFGCAGSNGLTNYLDRDVDARMTRTCSRVLPSRRIYPPQKALPVIVISITVALVLAWFLNPLCFIVGAVGVIASALWRKTITCTIFGIIASCSPVLIGWLAVSPVFSLDILLICLLICFWVPIHVWNVLIAKREEYHAAGLFFFPLNQPVNRVVRILMVLSLLLYSVSLAIYFVNEMNFVYLVIANILGLTMVASSIRLACKTSSAMAWRFYKLSSFPYLGIIFLAMCLDIWIF